MDYKKIVDEFKESQHFDYMIKGENYYLSLNDILEREKKVYIEGLGVKTNPFGANHRLPSGFFAKLVDQKVMHLLGNGVTFAEQEQSLDDYVPESFDEFIIDIGLEASKKAVSWCYFYKENGELRATLIPSEQIIPIEDEYGNIVELIRDFQIDKTHIRQIYTNEGMKEYIKKGNGFRLEREVGHYTSYKVYNDEIQEQEEHSFGEIPFIPCYNNKEHISDLFRIKALIDAYDIINSDFANNIDDMQDAYFTLKNYTGDTKNLSEFMRQLKLYKAVPVGEGGDVTSHQLEIPTEARKEMLSLLRQQIFETAMGLDMSVVRGSSLTNVAIQAMFVDLDLKTDKFENEIRKFIYHFIGFVNRHDNKNYTDQMTFDRSNITNHAERINTLLSLQGILSQETIIEMLPYDIDLEQEQQRLEKEQGALTLDTD